MQSGQSDQKYIENLSWNWLEKDMNLKEDD